MLMFADTVLNIFSNHFNNLKERLHDIIAGSLTTHLFYGAMSSPPDFIISASQVLGVGVESIRQAKRNIESPELVGTLDRALFNHLRINNKNSSLQTCYDHITDVLHCTGYHRPWSATVRERLFALTWVSMITHKWRILAQQRIHSSFEFFPRLAVLFPENLRQSFPLPSKTISLHKDSKDSILAKVTSIANRKNHIRNLLRTLKQLDRKKGQLELRILDKLRMLHKFVPSSTCTKIEKLLHRQHLKFLAPVIAGSIHDQRGGQDTPSMKIENEFVEYKNARDINAVDKEHEAMFCRWLNSCFKQGQERDVCNVEWPSKVKELGEQIRKALLIFPILEEEVSSLVLKGAIVGSIQKASHPGTETLGGPRGVDGAITFKDIFTKAMSIMSNKSEDYILNLSEEKHLSPGVDIDAIGYSIPWDDPKALSILESLLNIAPLPQATLNKSLSELRAKHKDMLKRAANACERFCPYEFSI